MCSLDWGLAFIGGLVFSSPLPQAEEVFHLSRKRERGISRLSRARERECRFSRERERRIKSSEATGNVILGLLLRRFGKQDFSRAELDELAEIHECGEVRAAR